MGGDGCFGRGRLTGDRAAGVVERAGAGRVPATRRPSKAIPDASFQEVPALGLPQPVCADLARVRLAGGT